MSGALIPIAGKMITGALVGKVVGKVTGNDKLAMLAAIGAGAMMPGSAFGAADTTVGASTAPISGSNFPTATASTGGGLLDAASGALDKSAAWMEANPTATKILGNVGGGAVVGGATLYAKKKEAEALKKAATLQHERDKELLAVEEGYAGDKYDREHQGFTPRNRAPAPGGMLSTAESGAAPTPGSAAAEYYNNFLSMYGRGVR